MRGIFGTLVDAAATYRAEVDVDKLLTRYFGRESNSGVTVSVDSALGVPTVLACARLIGEGIGQIPGKILKEDFETGKKTIAREHAAHRALARRPNPWQTPIGFRETMTIHAVLCGRGVAFKNMVRGKLRELIPIPPSNVTIRRQSDYSLLFEVVDQGGKWIATLKQDEVFYLVGPTWDGYSGLDVVRLAREAIGLAIATEANHAHLHKNGSQLGGTLTNDKPQTEAQVKRLRELWAQRHTGLSNAFKTAVLDGGWKFTSNGMTGVDAEHLATREFQAHEICRALGVYPMMVGFADKTATFASAEAFFTAHVVNTLGPWVTRWQETVETQLLTEAELDQGYICKLFTAGLLRGDARARSEFYKSGILTGWMVRNEARRLEDLDPIDGLDEPLVPLNMGIAGDPIPDDQGKTQNTGLPNIPIAPKGLVDAMRAAWLGHNGGPPIDERKNIGRILSSENESLIRSARDDLTTVLDKVSDQAPAEE